MSPAEAAIREALPKLEEWVAEGCPVFDVDDVYPDDFYAAVTRPAAIRSLLSELDALRARCEAGEALLREAAKEIDGATDWQNALLRRIDAHLKGAGQ